ncbi:hypothetical protein B0T25DRAFT_352318 [Lasiosphaeria hispida]|uniref:Uncharacterized protein n=1 Tax=Lasiosphaeria hispida TaxID=260671 RepID=A0AAJ0H7K9_9PEZI|nr:hypothetical protein B0T25DRAFT_352318 [Lasiosphaeria hispida]
MDSLQDLLDAYGHQAKTLTCGCMIGTAILFPLANTLALWFRAVTLSIFILTGLAFHGLHPEPFVKFGPFTAPLALLILVLSVLPASSPRAEIVPWLPLFIAFTSLLTVAVHELSKRFSVRRRANVLRDELSGVSIDTLSNGSVEAGTGDDGPRNLPPAESNRFESLYYSQNGPPSHYSRRTGDSEISLSDRVGQAPSDWDSITRGFFPGNQDRPATEQQEHVHAPLDSGVGSEVPNQELASGNLSVRSDQPLLEPL